MEHYRYVIIGGGIAGVTAAETIREHDADGRIALVSGEPHLLYSRVMLPAYLKKKISRDRLFLRTRDEFVKKNIDVFLGVRAERLDIKSREVALENGEGIGFEKLLIAAGGAPRTWGSPELQKWIYRLQTIDDADRLDEALPRIKKPLVIGASFIALEFLEIFAVRGAAPALFVRGKNIFGDMLDREGSALLEDNFLNHSIAIYYDDRMERITEYERKLAVLTAEPRVIECDALALGIGISRSLGWMRDSGIEIGKEGIRVNEFLETAVEGIFAAGDIAEYYDSVSGRERAGGSWTHAFLQGQHAGGSMAGIRMPFRRVSSYSITSFGFQITMLGDCRGRSDAIVRSDSSRRMYARLCLDKGALVGAALINRFEDKAHLAALMETKTPLEKYRDKLIDPSFDIRSIAIVG